MTVLLVAFAAFFCGQSVLSNPYQEHEQLQPSHPCGEPGLDFRGLTGFFQYQWKADFRDLNDEFVGIWLRYHGLDHTGISVVRLFRSIQQPTVAVMHGRRFVNYMDEEKTQPLVDMLCIVKVNGSHVLQFSMEEIETILRSGGTKT